MHDQDDLLSESSCDRAARPSRRGFLRRGVAGGLGVALLGRSVVAAVPSGAQGGAAAFGPLLPPDANGLRLPAGFSSRVVAVSGRAVGASGYVWHASPDGGVTFATGDEGWLYVSNSEVDNGGGGVGVLRFDALANVVDAWPILTGTSRNCAGGPTPWGTWLSCEEVEAGEVWECDPFRPGPRGVARPDMGRFHHEAAAVDPVRQVVYLTEDRPDGLLYRFTPSSYPDLSSGLLEAAEVLDPLAQGPIAPGQTRPLDWHVVPDPTLAMGVTPTRYQVPDATPFNGGEGCWYHAGRVYFSTKGDDRVWMIDAASDQLGIVYDLASSPMPELSGVDNVTVTPDGDVLVAEDPGDLQIVALTTDGDVKPVVQLTGVAGTEITGPALAPDGWRLYFSSQRNPGVTFELRGPFLAGSVLPSERGNLVSSLLGAILSAAGL